MAQRKQVNGYDKNGNVTFLRKDPLSKATKALVKHMNKIRTTPEELRLKRLHRIWVHNFCNKLRPKVLHVSWKYETKPRALEIKLVRKILQKYFFEIGCADEIRTSVGMRCPWTVEGVALFGAFEKDLLAIFKELEK